jgi:D-glycero-alpha-D-manno-heptose 1-phosphate guanylyltransferase
MEAIILAGGLGRRLRSEVPDLPKPMAPINGKPFLEYLLNYLNSSSFSRVIISVGYKCEYIYDYFGEKYKNLSIIIVKEEIPLGTGGGCRLALSKCKSDHVYVFNGDTFLEVDFKLMELTWKKYYKVVMASYFVEDTFRYGRLETDGNKVISINEKGIKGKGMINAGCYLIPTDLFQKQEINRKFSLEENFISSLVKKRELLFVKSEGIFIDIGIPSDYRRAQNLLKSL